MIVQQFLLKKCANQLKTAESYTHTSNSLMCPKQIGTICFSKFFKFCSVFFAFVFFMFSGTGAANAINYPFSITTTNLSAGDKVEFAIQAKGTFYVSCGSGGKLKQGGVIVPTTIDFSSSVQYGHYECVYSTGGVKTINFGGVATGYSAEHRSVFAFNNGASSDISSSNELKIASVSGNLSAIFPYLGAHSDGLAPIFFMTFSGCTNLTSIPDTLFSGYSGNLSGAESLFESTFSQTGLTSIPNNLFSNITNGADGMFAATFAECTGLTSIPNNLFSNITTGGQYMFYGTFWGCSNLTGYVPPTLFSGLINNNSPYATDMMTYLFTDTGLVTSCPNGTEQYNTGYESYWNSKVSCSNLSYTVTYSCGAGSGPIPSSTSATYDSLFTPATNTCTAPSGKLFVGWGVSGTDEVKLPGDEFTWKYTGNKTLTAQYIDTTPTFSVTTTNLSANDSVVFYLLAYGTFYVDCGSGGTLYDSSTGNAISNNIVGGGLLECRYSTGGVKTIGYAGRATRYSGYIGYPSIYFGEGLGTAASIASVSGDLSSIFPYMGAFNDGLAPNFYETFSGCTNLTSVPDTLFSGYSGNLSDTSAMFAATFAGSGLTELPENLFSNITTGGEYMFVGTFQGCSNLTGYVPPTLFSGLINNNSPYATNMMTDIFANTNLATSCNNFTDKQQYITGYESYWNSKVSCSGLPYTVTYSCGNGSGTPPENAGAKNGVSFTPAANTCTAPNGYVVSNKWAVSGTNDIKTAGTAFTWRYNENKTFTAQYEPTYTVTYSCGTGSGTAPETVADIVSGSSFTPAANTCTAPNGYSFSKWKVSGTVDVKNAGTAFTWRYNENKTFTAQYTPNLISVTFDNATANMCTYGDRLNVPTPQNIPGYVFVRWKLKVCSVAGLDYTIDPSDGAYISNDGQNTYNSNSYGVSQNGEFAMVFDYGTIKGVSSCNTTSPSEPSESDYEALMAEAEPLIQTYGDDFYDAYYDGQMSAEDAALYESLMLRALMLEMSTMPADTFDSSEHGTNCWCRLSAYTPAQGNQCDLTSSQWFSLNAGYESESDCASNCAATCLDWAGWDPMIRMGLFADDD